MREAYEALRLRALRDCGKIVFSDETSSLSREELLQRVGALARELSLNKKAIGILASNGVAWAVAQLAGAVAGKTVVPLPTFFSAEQLGHIIRDADIGLILCSDEFRALAAPSGVAARPIDEKRRALPVEFREGFQANHLYVWKHGPPQGRATWWPSNGMVDGGVGRGERRERKRFHIFRFFPLPLLLETICAIFIPLLVGGKTHFLNQGAKIFGAGQALGVATMFENAKPSSSVLVPQLLDAWVEELTASGIRAPNLAFRRGGGRPRPRFLSKRPGRSASPCMRDMVFRNAARSWRSIAAARARRARLGSLWQGFAFRSKSGRLWSKAHLSWMAILAVRTSVGAGELAILERLTPKAASSCMGVRITFSSRRSDAISVPNGSKRCCQAITASLLRGSRSRRTSSVGSAGSYGRWDRMVHACGPRRRPRFYRLLLRRCALLRRSERLLRSVVTGSYKAWASHLQRPLSPQASRGLL